MQTLNQAIVGNGQVLALIGPDTCVDWMCMPRFDSPSIFGRLLDDERGGTWKVDVHGQDIVFKSDYIENTNILRTLICCDGGSCEVIDFCPRYPVKLDMIRPSALYRIVRPIRGNIHMSVTLNPAPNYALNVNPGKHAPHAFEISHAGGHATFVAWGAPADVFYGSPFLLNQKFAMAMTWNGNFVHRGLDEVEEALRLTQRYWRSWVKACNVPSYHPKSVIRSALCLKLHTFEESGAIIAAATTSIPESEGTERTWDYRYCWLRDAAFVIAAFGRLGHVHEGMDFLKFLVGVVNTRALQPVYGIHGETELHEQILEHLKGFRQTRPVRIGNAAYLQNQHDLMGELMLCIDTMLDDPRIAEEDRIDTWSMVQGLVETALDLYDKTDTGLWEYRSMPGHYTFSKVLCWVAAHRGAHIARIYGHVEQANIWEAWADQAKSEILLRAYNKELGYFTQCFDGIYPDASNLLLPMLGFISAKDPRFVSTLDQYEKVLVKGGAMQRYTHPDDFGCPDTCFLICSFWWVEALALSGQIEKAIKIFDFLTTLANPFGLYSEDWDSGTKTLVGNFPQAYTHVGLIHAACTIGSVLEVNSGKVHSWAR